MSYVHIARGVAAAGGHAQMFASARDVVVRAAGEGVPVTELPVAHTSLRAPGLLRQALRQHGIEVLLVDKRRDLVHGALAVRGTGIGLAIRFNFPRWEAPRDPLARLAYSRVDLTIFLTQSAVQFAESHVSYMLRPPHVVIPEGIDVQRFRRDAEAGARFRQRVGIADGPMILGLAALEPEKRFHVLIDAVGGLPEPRPPVVLVGAGSERESLTRRAHELTVDLRLCDYLTPEDLPGAYSAATIFVHPSTMETFGLSVAEAMAAGCPVVVASAGSLPEVVGDAGVVVPSDDPGAFTVALARLLGSDVERYALAQRATARVAERFSLEQMQRAHVEALRSARASRLTRTP
ncbi:MAG TPA: glycosyltransferase family 4 protein [Gemmatimonadales bacterium]|nr:glycosyltransferase family 4 protein [Gemmatimonadales bacterium]